MTKMNVSLLSLIAVLVVAWSLMHGSGTAHAADRVPVLVELFTSEGCSSCPPADRLLEKFDHQPLPGAELIVLSEHVDYWNHLGWNDPYSARFYSERQSAYARRFGLDGPYTPQMVVDGSSQFVGSDTGLASKALEKAIGTVKIPLRLSSMSIDASNALVAHLETGMLEPSFGERDAEIYVAIALSRAESQVGAGENAGHKLAHVSVVRSLTKVGVTGQGQTFAKDIHIKLESGWDPHNLRLIAFMQAPKQGRILGSVSTTVNVK